MPDPESLPPRSNTPVSWYEFLLDWDLLEKHLKQETPVPSGTQLIIQFLQHAEDGSTADRDVNGTPGKPNGQDNTSESGAPVKNRKSRALKILALKVAAFYNWNLSELETRLPFTMIKSLLSELLEASTSPDSQADHAQFALQLWHRWSLRTIIRTSFPPKPSKMSNIAVPGLTELIIPIHGPNESEVKTLLETSKESVSFLEQCSSRNQSLAMPTMSCFGELNEDVDEVVYQWQRCTNLQMEDVASQVCFDLGCFYFYKEDYSKALVNFNRVEECLTKLEKPLYTKIDSAQLAGYCSACRSLQHVSGKRSSLIQRIEVSRSDSYQGIVSILLEDNCLLEIPIPLRKAVQEDIARLRPEVYPEVFICNTVREVRSGKCVLSSFIATINEKGDATMFKFLLQACEQVVNLCNSTERLNIKCFLRYVAQSLPRESNFIDLLLQSSLKIIFAQKELDGLSHLGKDHGVELSKIPTSYPAVKDASLEIGRCERQLIVSYDPQEVVGLVTELSRSLKTLQILSLSDKWKVPRDIRQVLNSLEASPALLSAHILVAKGKQCVDRNLLDTARQLFTEATKVVQDISYKLSKLLRWEVLMVDLLTYQEDESSLLETSKQVKTCLTALRLETENKPRPDIIAYCVAFLVNRNDWIYISNLGNSYNGHIEFCRLLCDTCKEIPSVKVARKPARELWDAVVQIFTMQSQTKRSSSGAPSLMSRDSQLGLMSPVAFTQFLTTIREPVALAVLISCLTKLYGMAKDDSNYEICSEFGTLWPTALNSTINATTITDCVNVLMQHALSTDPTHPPWFKTQADINYGSGQYSSALRYYLECGVTATNYFSTPLPRFLFDDQTFRKMLKCCINLQCFTQAAVLCQFLDEVDYTTAFKVLQEKTSLDAMDVYYPCVWDPTMLEFIIHLHNRKGELEKKQIALQSIGELELNSSNPEDILHRAAESRRRTFLRSMAKQYL